MASTKVTTGVVRLSYANVWEAKSFYNNEPRYSVSIIIPKDDKETLNNIKAAIAAAIDEKKEIFGDKTKKENIKIPLKDGDIEKDDEVYKNSYYLNAKSIDPPGIIDRMKQPIFDKSEIYSGVYARVSINFYAYNVNGSKGIACGLGHIQFYGASRTGRYAGRLIQVQNLPQNKIQEIDVVRELIKSKNYDAVELLYDSVQGVLSELIRTAFVPEDNHKFYVVDFSAIEARVIAWLAGETWRNEVFKTHGKIYEASASHMFNIPLNEINKELRQKGKIAELALGYGGSVRALIAMGTIKMGLKEEELMPLVNAWRNPNQNIVNLWRAVNQAAIRVVNDKKHITLKSLNFYYDSGILFIQLPSGRNLVYTRPKVEVNRFGSNSITFSGVSRDILAEAIMRLSTEGYKIVMHCHDEVVIESQNASLDEIIKIMTVSPNWAKCLKLNAEGYECNFYKKD